MWVHKIQLWLPYVYFKVQGPRVEDRRDDDDDFVGCHSAVISHVSCVSVRARSLSRHVLFASFVCWDSYQLWDCYSINKAVEIIVREIHEERKFPHNHI